MSAKEKARPTATTVERAGRETACGARFPHSNCTTGGIDRQPGFIAGLLLYGPENGQTLRDLVHITQWPERAIRKEIEVERRAGALIMSDNRSGYYLTNDPAEAKRFARSMLHRSREIARTARAVEKAAGLTRREPMQIDRQEVFF